MFIFVCAIQLNVKLGEFQDPLILPNNKGMLLDIFNDVIEQVQPYYNNSIEIIYQDESENANITLNFIQNFDSEKGLLIVQDEYDIDYNVYDVSEQMLTENYLFIYPTLLGILFQRIIWELFINYLLIIFPWVMICANTLIFLLPKNKSYSGKLRIALQILIGNEKTNMGTLIFKIGFLISTILISAIVFIDFIYVVANEIQKQNFSSLNDLAINQFNLCIVENDAFILDMVKRYRDISYVQQKDLYSCFDMIYMSQDTVVFVSEFLYGLSLKSTTQANIYKYQLKQNSYRSYLMLMNKSISLDIRQSLNESIENLWLQKYDVEIRKEYLIQLVYVKSNVVSLIFSNNTFLLCSFLASLLVILFIQISITTKQFQIQKKKLPYKILEETYD